MSYINHFSNKISSISLLCSLLCLVPININIFPWYENLILWTMYLSSIHLTDIYQISGICCKWVLKSHQHGTNSRTPEKSPCSSLFASLSLLKDGCHISACRARPKALCQPQFSSSTVNMAATSHMWVLSSWNRVSVTWDVI